MELALDLVNTYTPAQGPQDDLVTVADLQRFMSDHEPGEWDQPFKARDVEEVRALRQRLQEILDAQDVTEAVRQINDLLEVTSPRPYISDHDGTPLHLHVVPPDARVAHYLGAVSGMALASMVIEDGMARFGRCASDTCDDVFVDTSKNRSRRYCSEGCSNRSNVRRFRARSRAGGD